MHDRQRKAIRDGDLKRIIELLEIATDADKKEQCKGCGGYFNSVSHHEPHCKGFF